MRRVALVLAAMALALLLASGVAWAVNEIGTDGPDTLRGTNADDNLLGRGGNDVIFGLGGRDNMLGGSGNDWVLGGNERRPGGGDKNLLGGPGNDAIIPGVGSDNASGGSGNDLFAEPTFREAAKDTYSGGSGNDVFVVNNTPASEDIVVCGSGLDRVLADREDTVAPDCERVLFGLTDEEFFETIPASFFEGLAPPPFGEE